MKALICRTDKPRSYISEWALNADDSSWSAIRIEIEGDVKRVTEIVENEFDVHSDFFWVDTDISGVDPSSLYYDSADQTVKQIVDASHPDE